VRCLTTELAEQGQGPDLSDSLLPDYGACNSAQIPYLVVLTSSNQLYSGTGVAIFEWIRYAKHIFDFAICIDNQIRKNYVVAREFCIAHGITFLPSGPAPVRGGPDPGVADSQIHVGSGRWPIIEIVSWANTATNLDVINACPPGSMLVYTPHTQPAWTLPNASAFWLLESSFDRALAAAHLVCCVAPSEVEAVRRRVPSCYAVYTPNPTDTARFCLRPGERTAQILMVADFKEPRKRVDLGIAAMSRLLRRRPNFRAILAGRGSNHVLVPPDMTNRFDRLGYVSNTRLVDLYQSATVFLLLSDYEAFGIPIVEALACGTPVVTTASAEARSLFTGMPGCYLVPNRDADAVDAAMDAAIGVQDRQAIARTAHKRFSTGVACQAKLRAIEARMLNFTACGSGV
jgi:glycosyltransferase involved in cell wall biosynthesis